MTSLWQRIASNWKSTLTGLCIFIITVCGVLSQSSLIPGKVAAILALISAVVVALEHAYRLDPGSAAAAVAQAIAVNNQRDAANAAQAMEEGKKP